MKTKLYLGLLLVVALGFAAAGADPHVREVFFYWGSVLIFLGIFALVVLSVLRPGQRDPKLLILRPIVSGAMAALLVTWLGGPGLEAVTGRVIRWEYAAVPVVLVNVPGGAAVGLLGALSRRWSRGLVIGAVLHTVFFAFFVTSDETLRIASLSTKVYAVAAGIAGGALAGALGGVMRSLHERANAKSESPSPRKTPAHNILPA